MMSYKMLIIHISLGGDSFIMYSCAHIYSVTNISMFLFTLYKRHFAVVGSFDSTEQQETWEESGKTCGKGLS